MSLRLSFHGAAGTVTGSRFLVEAGRTQFLVDCGLFQGLKQLRLKNWEPFDFEAPAIEAVALTHAHIDHSGALPLLVKRGFRGPIYATPATIELAEVLLLDAADLQEEDAAYANRKGFSKHHPALPLFDEADARRALRRFKAVPEDRWQAVGSARVRFHNAGHILGAAFIEAELPLGGAGVTTAIFSGDLGRCDVPLHVDPDPLPPCDTLVLEGTYGDREHNDEPFDRQLVAALRPALAAGGIVLMPAFAVARAQLLTLLLTRLVDDGRLPRVPIHLDSPMAVDVSGIYRGYAGDAGQLDPDVQQRDLGPAAGSTFHFHRTVQDSIALNDLPGPRIIISSSGMLTGGRVLHHLRRLAGDAKNLLVLPGYQAAGTRGRVLAEGGRWVRIHGADVEVRCKVVQLDGLSAHADHSELLDWATGGHRPRNAFVVHAEPPAATALAGDLRRRSVRVHIPALGDAFEFVEGSRSWRSVAR
jgi:metallo-beta-lactamase family protein